MFQELNSKWQRYNACRCGHLVNPTWIEKRMYKKMFSKLTTTWMHRLAVGRGPTYHWKYVTKQRDNEFCRLGCDDPETIQHIFVDCHVNVDKREILRKKCREEELELTLPNIFSNEELHYRAEQFIGDYFNA